MGTIDDNRQQQRMPSSDVEQSVKYFYETEGWIVDSSGNLGEDGYFRKGLDSRGDFGLPVTT
ncbi:MAG: hypothetical protein EXQ96_08130 [Alphaproteobacteria bacterium]|nr:hypothetical protein [Alphaproteobacteria bacterium]